MENYRKTFSTLAHFRAVDIPLEEPGKVSPAQFQQSATSQRLTLRMDIKGDDEEAFRRGFGFSVTGGVEGKAPITVDTVIVDTPADRCGLQIGDVVVSINGQPTVGMHFPVVRKILADATRSGSLAITVQRALINYAALTNVHPKRNGKDKTFSDSFEEFKKKLTAEGGSARGNNSTGAALSFVSEPAYSSKRYYRYERSPDYKVMSLENRPDPGKLDDFIPEVERNTKFETSSGSTSRSSPKTLRHEEEPRLIRNYDLEPAGNGAIFHHETQYLVGTASDIKRAEEKPQVDPREWRQFVAQQRLPNPGYTDSRNRNDADSRFRIIHRPVERDGSLTRPIISTVSNAHSMSFPRQYNRAKKEIPVRREKFTESQTDEEQEDPVLTVSGKQRCAHCSLELGRGAAMVIDSLKLLYHLSCFKCYVCNTPLGNGSRGADVRVRGVKLHCQKCYSNDSVGLKFSQI